MGLVTDADIKNELRSAIGSSSAVVPLCVALCRFQNLSAQEFGEYWEAYSMSNNLTELDEEAVEKLKRYIEAEKKKDQAKTPARQFVRRGNTGTTPKTFDKDSLDLLEETFETPAASRKRATPNYRTPDTKKQAVGSTGVSPGSFASPAGAPDFAHRTNAGKVEFVHNEHIPKDMQTPKRSAADIEVAIFGNCQVSEYRYMFEKLHEKAEELDARLTYLGHQVICPRHKITETGRLGVPCTDLVTVVGRICCDSEGRMNDKSIVLEGTKEESGGARVQLDLSEMEEFSLFPGQIVAVEGFNTTGNRMVAKKIYQNARRPFVSTPVQELAQRIETGGLRVMAAVGPFTTYSDLSYQPLDDLIKVAEQELPDVLILMGPFMDANHPLISDPSTFVDQTFTEVFNQEIVGRLITLLEKTPALQVVVVPSLQDIHHDFVLPQPPLKISVPEERVGRLHSLPNPCTLTINEVTVGIGTCDVIKQLMQEEVARVPGKGDKFGRIANHLIEQRSFYPLYPAKETNVDMTHTEQVEMPCTPDILLLASDLRFFAKNVNGCLAVNPGRLTKAQSGGTYVKFTVQPLNVDVNAIKPHPHLVAGRTRVEIVRI